MELRPKFSLRQKVFCVEYRKEKVFIPCPACKEKGSIKCKDRLFYPCPKCHGAKGSITQTENGWWVVVGPLKVSQNMFKREEEIRYMLYSFGPDLGDISREIYGENDIFASCEEAEAECERRNKK